MTDTPTPEMAPAIRTVSETDDTHTIEMRLSYGGPFNGKDTYRTSFTPKTDWALDLHPEGVPVLFNHGFDDDFGLTPIGRSSPTATFRTDKDGMWVQAQLDKRHQYYATRVRPLLDKNALGASQGSAEHSVRIDGKTGEVRLWPLQEISLTPTEANPWNMIAARSGEVARLLIVGARSEEPVEEPVVEEAVEPTDETARTADVPEAEPEVAVRAGKRNSKGDQALIDQIHDRLVQLGATAHPDAADAQPNDDSPPAESDDDAARSGDSVPRIVLIREPANPAAVRASIDEAVNAIAREAASAFVRRPSTP